MKSQLLLPVPIWLCLAALTAAQAGLSDLPKCATTPAISSIQKTGCSLTDYACICKNSAFVDELTGTIQKECKPDEIQKVQKFANDLCSPYGVTVGDSTASATNTGSVPAPTTNSTATTTASTTTATQTAGAAARYGSSSSFGMFEISGLGLLASLGALSAAVAILG